MVGTRTVLICGGDNCHDPIDVLPENLKPSPHEYMKMTGWSVVDGKDICPSCTRSARWDLLRARKKDFIFELAQALLDHGFLAAFPELVATMPIEIPPVPGDGEDAGPKVQVLVDRLTEFLA